MVRQRGFRRIPFEDHKFFLRLSLSFKINPVGSLFNVGQLLGIIPSSFPFLLRFCLQPLMVKLAFILGVYSGESSSLLVVVSSPLSSVGVFSLA